MSSRLKKTKKSIKTSSKPKTNHRLSNIKQRINKFSHIFIPILITFFLSSFIFSDSYHLAFDSNVENDMIKRTIYIVASILLIIYSYTFIYKTTISEKLKNIFLSVYTTFILFFVFEIIFMYLPISEGSDKTYCSALWFKKYWKTNELGYRDKSYIDGNDTTKTNIVMLGDSYTAGHGIEYEEDRMSNLIERKLSKNYRVCNLGRCGFDTEQEYENLKKFPYKFQYLILVHVPNDLDYLNKYDNYNKQEIHPNVFDNIAEFFVTESFFVNFLSSTILGGIIKNIRNISWNKNNHVNLQNDLYPFSDTVKLREHISNLVYMDSDIRNINVKMLVVSFPYPGNVDKTADKYYKNFIQKLKENNLDYIDALELCRKLKPRQQIVSSLDKHPSKKVQIIVADSIYQHILTNGWIHK